MGFIKSEILSLLSVSGDTSGEGIVSVDSAVTISCFGSLYLSCVLVLLQEVRAGAFGTQ